VIEKFSAMTLALLKLIKRRPLLTSAPTRAARSADTGALIDPISPASSMGVHPTTVEELYVNDQSLCLANYFVTMLILGTSGQVLLL
jgi:hypothetical protein